MHFVPTTAYNNDAMRRNTFLQALASTWVLLSFCGASFGGTVKRVDDAGIAQLASSKGVVVLNYWATWCAPCRAEIPELNGLASKYPNAHFVGISLDDVENEGAIPGYLKHHPVQYEVARWSGGDFEATASKMDPQWKGGIPATFVFQDGKRLFSKLGAIDKNELESVLQSALK